MFELIYEDLNKNGLLIKDVAVISDNVNPDKYRCIKGDKTYNRLFYIISGTIYFNKNTDNCLTATEGTVLYLPDDVVYVSEWDKSVKGEYISINFNLEDENKNRIAFSEYIEVVYKDKKYQLLNEFKSALEFYRTGSKNHLFKLRSIVFDLLYFFLNESEKTDLKNEENAKNIYKSILYLKQHFTENLPIAELAGISNVSEATFRRYFKKYTNETPVEYRTRLRLEKANELLKSGLYSVYEIADIVGYCDIASFSKAYKKEYGCTPMTDKNLFD